MHMIRRLRKRHRAQEAIKRNLVIQEEQVVLNVGAASSRDS
jgi:hypothetical protein